MKKFSFLLITGLLVLVMLSSCRPPELEGAFVDFNANRIDQALVNAEKATAKYPGNAEAWFLLGKIYGKKDRFGDMVNAYDKSLTVSKQYEIDIQNERLYYFQTSFNKGVTNYNAFLKQENRETEQAVKIIDNAIRNFKNAKLIKEDYKSTDLLATCYNISVRPEEAFAYYQELIKIDPDTADSWIAVGNYYFVSQKYDKTIENMEKALEIDPNNVEAITLVSQSYDMLEDTENALKSYERAKLLNKEEKAFPYNLGLIYNKLVNVEGLDEATKTTYFDKIVENFGQVIDLDPTINVPYQMKAFAEIHQKKYDEAIVTLKAGIEQFPTDGALLFNLGVAYTHQGKKTEAQAAFDKAEELGYK